MSKCVLMLGIAFIVLSLQCVASEREVLTIRPSGCESIGCTFSTIPGDVDNNHVWVQVRLPVVVTGSGRISHVSVGFEQDGNQILKIPVNGYLSKPEENYYISEFQVAPSALQNTYIMIIYGAEKSGREREFKILGLEDLTD